MFNITFISQNRNAEDLSGTLQAIKMGNSIQGDVILYAGHGLIELAQNISLKEVTAYKILIKNTAQVTYESGLANLLFTNGPGGDFEMDWYREVQ